MNTTAEERAKLSDEAVHHTGLYFQSMIDLVLGDLDEALAIVEKLPKTADGVPVNEGDTVWYLFSDAIRDQVPLAFTATLVVLLPGGSATVGCCYSTQAAAEAAKKDKPDG